MKSIIIASLLSLTITFGGYVGLVKLTAKKPGHKSEESAVLTKEDLTAAEFQLKGVDEQKALLLDVQGALAAMQSDMDIARNVLLEEQRKLVVLHRQLRDETTAMKEQNEEALGKLAKLYESMKPAEAAEIASHLDVDLVVEIVPRMKERAAAKMLAAMSTDKAVAITKLISQRKNRPQKTDKE